MPTRCPSITAVWAAAPPSLTGWSTSTPQQQNSNNNNKTVFMSSVSPPVVLRPPVPPQIQQPLRHSSCHQATASITGPAFISASSWLKPQHTHTHTPCKAALVPSRVVLISAVAGWGQRSRGHEQTHSLVKTHVFSSERTSGCVHLEEDVKTGTKQPKEGASLPSPWQPPFRDSGPPSRFPPHADALTFTLLL